MAIEFTSGLFQGLDNDGNIVPYGLVYFTDPNTGDAIQTYKDSDLTQPNTHPVVLSPSGKAYIVVPDGTTADIRYDNADGVTIWFLEDYDVTDQTAIDNLSAILVSAQDAADSANDSDLNAASWADEDEDVPVKVYTDGVPADRVPTVYSAKHWEAKAAAAELDVAAAEAAAEAAQLSEWESEASNLTCQSYAVEPEDVEVKVYTSNGDGTYTATIQTGVFSSLHYNAKAQATTGSINGLNDVDAADRNITNQSALYWNGTNHVANGEPVNIDFTKNLGATDDWGLLSETSPTAFSNELYLKKTDLATTAGSDDYGSVV